MDIEKAEESAHFLEIPTIPYAREIFEDLAGRLRVYEMVQESEQVGGWELIAEQADGGKVEKVKHKGRYRLSEDEIEFRRGKVEEANAEKKSNPMKRWQEIDAEFADRLKIAPRSFRHWRHNNY